VGDIARIASRSTFEAVEPPNSRAVAIRGRDEKWALYWSDPDDPELRYTQSGAALAGFTVAVSHRSKHNGEWQDVTDGFFRCTAWRSVAENASRTLKKGMRIFVAGKLIQRSCQDDAGNKRQNVEVQVSHVGPAVQFATAEVVKSTTDGSPATAAAAE
jgi:single-strand DNA-binding protein